jgi:glycosyltransferase involved in cell wall biosynthesis
LLKYDIIVWGEPIISINSFLFIPILKFLNKKVVLWLDDWGYKKSVWRNLVEPYYRFIILISDGLLAHGIKHFSYFLKLGVKKEQIFFIGNASTIFKEFATKNEIEKIRNMMNKKYILLYVGGLIKRKNVDKIIRALYHLKNEKKLDAGLLIVGQGPEFKKLYKLTLKLNLKNDIKFIGWVPFHKIANYYLASDIFVFPAEKEPWGLVINEALEAGIPVVTSKDVGASELIIDGINGIVINKINEIEIANAIYKFLNFPTNNNNQKIKCMYNYEYMAEKFKDALLKIHYY